MLAAVWALFVDRARGRGQGVGRFLVSLVGRRAWQRPHMRGHPFVRDAGQGVHRKFESAGRRKTNHLAQIWSPFLGSKGGSGIRTPPKYPWGCLSDVLIAFLLHLEAGTKNGAIFGNQKRRPYW